jgi:uncharacterized membrane protein YphA (DoxX/SURF4 family)
VPHLAWVLRLGVAGEFIGHGWVGTGRPAAWLPFFHAFGFSSDFADAMMPVIGAWDITVGLLMLVLPLRLLLVWTAVWGLVLDSQDGIPTGCRRAPEMDLAQPGTLVAG